MGRPPASSDVVRRRFEKQKRKDTDPELRLRRALYARGVRYRVTYPVPGLPRRSIDVAFPRQRVAVFADGCYWHGCPEHFIGPKRNTQWWLAKIRANQERDRITNEMLQASGWVVIRVWEHQLRTEAELRVAVDQVIEVVSSRRSNSSST